MVNLTINSIPVTVPEGTTILDAAASVDIEIPSLCYLKELNEISACRVCCVEVEGEGKLVPSCNNVVREGMVIRTNSPRALEARRVNMELILSQHDNKCATCIRSGTCQLQKIANDMGILGVSYPTDLARGKKADWTTTFPLYRDVNKCIKCMRCIQVCDKVQSLSVWDISGSGARTTIDVSGNRVIKQADCSLCGQCITHCPTGALRERDDTQKAYAALGDPDRVTIVQIAPAVRAAWGEAFGMPTGKATVGQLVSVLRKLGADYVFDTTFSADLTIMEEGTEFLERFRAVISGGVATLPMITSCSPGWIQFIEHNYPEHLDNLSTCKSPHEMFGAVVKSYYAKKLGKKPEDMYVVSIMPCTAKKTECARPELSNDGVPNVDAVLTTRELGDLIKTMGINFHNLPEEEFDAPLGFSTGAADIFGVTGGVMEAALRTVYEIITGRELPFPNLHVSPIVGLEQVKEATIKLENVKPEWKAAEGFEVKIAVTSGYAGARQLMDQVREGTSPYHFIEVMGCPGGCITGGGQPRPQEDINIVRQKRMEAIYGEDERKIVRKSHENQSLMNFYKEWGDGKGPGCHASHEYLHTHYVKRGKYNELTTENFVVNK